MTLVNESLPFEFPDFESLGEGKGYDSIPYHLNRMLQEILRYVHIIS